MANRLQMLVRHGGLDHRGIYDYYNMGHESYPDLPSPPNPDKLAAFFAQCVEEGILQQNRENDPKSGQERRGMTP